MTRRTWLPATSTGVPRTDECVLLCSGLPAMACRTAGSAQQHWCTCQHVSCTSASDALATPPLGLRCHMSRCMHLHRRAQHLLCAAVLARSLLRPADAGPVPFAARMPAHAVPGASNTLWAQDDACAGICPPHASPGAVCALQAPRAAVTRSHCPRGSQPAAAAGPALLDLQLAPCCCQMCCSQRCQARGCQCHPALEPCMRRVVGWRGLPAIFWTAGPAEECRLWQPGKHRPAAGLSTSGWSGQAVTGNSSTAPAQVV